MIRIVLKQDLTPGTEVAVDGDELHYLARVRRTRPGDIVEVRDMRGNAFEADVIAVGKRAGTLRIRNETAATGQAAAPVILAVAVPKQNLMDDVVRKLSEIGVSRLIPLVAERTARFPSNERGERWRRIAAAALRQCGRALPLEVSDPVRFEDFARDETLPASRLILHPTGGTVMTPRLLETNSVVLVVGPEGGFTEAEMLLADRFGFMPVTLNMPILRIETAALAAAVLGVALRPEETVDVNHTSYKSC